MSSSAGELLRERSLRRTGRRLRILDALCASPRPLAARELRAELGEGTVDLATVYRTLERFVSVSLVNRVRLDDGIARYEIAGKSHRHHMVCNQCGAIEALSDCRIAPLEESLMREHGFLVASHSLEFFGTCQGCAPKRP
jgi:Fur family transcriptional regulator, ferric uptake regulator